MKNTPTDPVPLRQDLIRCKSVTPAEGGALAMAVLESLTTRGTLTLASDATGTTATLTL